MSLLLPDDKVLVTPSGVLKERLQVCNSSEEEERTRCRIMSKKTMSSIFAGGRLGDSGHGSAMDHGGPESRRG